MGGIGIESRSWARSGLTKLGNSPSSMSSSSGFRCGCSVAKMKGLTNAAMMMITTYPIIEESIGLRVGEGTVIEACSGL